MKVSSSKLIIAISVCLTLNGCAPAQYMPQFDDTTLRTKQREISNQIERVPHETSEDPDVVLSRIYNRLEPRAREACIANGEKWLDSSCSNWRVQVLDDENFNAYATPNHEIVFTTEVFRYTKSDDELAFILAHEMGHHILNHAMEDVINAEIMGATTGLLSGILMGAIASGLGASESTVNDVIEDAIEDGYESGRKSGRLTYSIDQESEADKLALQLIELAGYSQAGAREIMLFIGADSSDLRSKHNATHPSGAERLAAFDLYASLTPDRSYSVSTSSNSVETKNIKHIYPTGEVYEGGWAKGIPHGKGRQTWPSGYVYEGDWVKGWMSGSGKRTYPNGNIYEGEFVNSALHGHGKLTFGTEDYYIGEFINDLKHGRGIERVDRVTRKGVWRDGKFSHDAYVSENEFEDVRIKYPVPYKKSNVNNKEDTIRYNNGDVYTGTSENGEPHGFGTFWSKTGKSCSYGGFDEGKRYGEAVLIFQGNIKYRGFWREQAKTTDNLRRITDDDQWTRVALKQAPFVKCLNRFN